MESTASNGPSRRYTIALDFNKDGEQHEEAAVIRGIRPEVLQRASLFQQLLADKTSDDGEELVVPMPSGDPKTMNKVLQFLNSDCSSQEAKSYCWPLPLDPSYQRHDQLFHRSIFRWLKQMTFEHDGSCKGLIEVLSLAHYIGAETLLEMVATFLSKEVLLTLSNEYSCVDSTADHFKFVPLHVRALIAKRLGSTINNLALEIQFPSLVDGLAAADEIWSDRWIHLLANVRMSSEPALRLLRRRVEQQSNVGSCSELLVDFAGMAQGSTCWAWLKNAVQTFSNITLVVSKQTTVPDWTAFLDLLHNNTRLEMVTLKVSAEQREVPQRLFDTLAAKPSIKSLVYDGGYRINPEVKLNQHILHLVGLEHFSCNWVDDAAHIEQLLVSLPNLKSLSLLWKDPNSSFASLNKKARNAVSCLTASQEALSTYNPTAHNEQVVLRWEGAAADTNIAALLKSIADANPRLTVMSVDRGSQGMLYDAVSSEL